MANTEKVGILTHIDDDGNKTELYPVVKTDSTLTTTGTPADAAATGAAVAEATNIAKGRNRARVFATTADMETWLKTAANKGVCNVGDNLYIVQVDVPDWWVSEVLTTADSTTGYYYKIAQLETQKVDLTTIEAALATKVTSGDVAYLASVSFNNSAVIYSHNENLNFQYKDSAGNLQGMNMDYIATQLNNKLNKGGHAVNKAVVTDGNGNITPTGITSAEIGALSGVTSNIQTQLNGKATLGGQPNFQGIHVGGAGAVGYIYPGGTDGNIWFRYQNASGQEHYTNMRTIVRGSVSGTTLILEIG